MRTLLRNATVRERFAASAQVLLDLHYTPERIAAPLDSMIALTAAARARSDRRWAIPDSVTRTGVESLRDFIRRRPEVVRGHLAEYFGLGEPARVRISVSGPGTVQAAGYPVAAGETELVLLRGTRLRVTAAPSDGSRLRGLTADTTLMVSGDAALSFRFGS